MKRHALAAILLATSFASADIITVESKIDSVGLFKNGLVLVDRVVELPGGGEFRLDNVPDAIHGVFFVESASPLVVKTSIETVDAEPTVADLAGDFQSTLAGKRVTILVRDGEANARVSGTIVDVKDAPASTAPIQPNYYGYPSNIVPGSRFLILDTAGGRSMIDVSTIRQITIDDGTKTIRKREPVMSLRLPDGSPAQTVRLVYLTRGISWAPSYRVDLETDKTLSIALHAVVRNELIDLSETNVRLISGYPNIEFSHVSSLLNPLTSWQMFFSQLANPPRSPRGGAVMQQAVMMNRAAYSSDSATPPDDLGSDGSVDMHYQDVGPWTLLRGESVAFEVGRKTADYETIVDWVVPDTRDAMGRPTQSYGYNENPDKFADAAWDSVRFKSPFDFPMTTGPASFFAGDAGNSVRFLGQTLSEYVAAGEETSLKITKALSVRTKSTEFEEPDGGREIVWVGGNDYRKSRVAGELSVTNYRDTPIKLVIKRQFSGELLSAELNPTVKLREEGAWSVNKRNELNWTIELKPGESKTIGYRYSLLVDN